MRRLYSIITSAQLTQAMINSASENCFNVGTLADNNLVKNRDNSKIIVPVFDLALFTGFQTYKVEELFNELQNEEWNNLESDMTVSGTETYANLYGFQTDATNKHFHFSSPSTNEVSKFSVFLRVKFDMTANATKYLFGKISGTDKIQIQWTNSRIYFYVNAGNVYAAPTRADKTYDILCTYDGTQADVDKCKIYIDGVNATVYNAGGFSTSLPASLNSVDYFVATRNDLVGTTNHSGLYQDLAIYTDVLTATDALNIYNGADIGDFISCVGSYWFGDNSGDSETTIKDNVQANDMTCVNIASGDIVTV